MTSQPSLFDVCETKHRGNKQSRAANLRVMPHKKGIRERARVFIAATEWYGATAQEIAQAFGKPLHTLSGRCSELRALGQVFDSGRVRDKGSVLVSRAEWVNPK